MPKTPQALCGCRWQEPGTGALEIVADEKGLSAKGHVESIRSLYVK
ncbi:MAG TPA: hypothetical protein VI457_08285 [Methylococcaceae bacterium]|nr:hypothetical protein [Methylococcaceae bacterium]